ncbi:MAG: dephospho-CoA kinase [Synechococcus sp.]|nr:dephospho-CoA kinase [Synechococcus sp.]
MALPQDRARTASRGPEGKPDPADPQPGDASGCSDGGLDAATAATCRRLAGELFPWDLNRSLELALLRTFCLPSISGLLDHSGEFARQPRKRYDDTGLMVSELLRHGPDSTAGAAVIQRMNRIHAAYAIRNDDFLYVLSTFVVEPIRWLEHYGWRALQPDEQEALFRFWRHVGERMGLRQLPASLEALIALNHRVEQHLFQPAASNRRVAEATLAMLLADCPSPLRPPLRRLLLAVVPSPVGRALGWRPAPRPLRGLVRAGLRWRSRAANAWQSLRPPRGSRFYSERPTPSYGSSFRLEQLGPAAMLQRLNSPRWSGRQRRIGLTGGIASGKSSVAALLAARGLPVLDADGFAREALAPGSPATLAVLQHFGEPVRALSTDAANAPAAIDRRALGRIVFADAAQRRWLEALLHPIVRARFEAELAAWAAAPVLVLMIPLLFEAGLESLCSEVWLVDCPEAEQLRRLIERDRLSEEEARARLAAQWPLARKRALADRRLDNGGDRDQLAQQLDQLFRRDPGLGSTQLPCGQPRSDPSP